MYNLTNTGPRESCEFKCKSQAHVCLGTFATSKLGGGGNLKRGRVKGGKRELL